MVKLKAEKSEFENIVMGHTFTAIGQGKLDKTKDEHFWCQFCGGRGQHYVVIERDDGRRFLVGKTCLGRVGLTYTHSLQAVLLKKSEMKKKVAAQKKSVATPQKVVRKPGVVLADKPVSEPEPKVEKVKEKESDDGFDDLFDEVE